VLSIPHLDKSYTWLVTGGAGFIGSHLVENLLRLDQRVRVLDNFSTGKRENLDEACSLVSPDQSKELELVVGDIQDESLLHSAIADVDYVLHQAALGSVPRSFHSPLATNSSNVTGFLTLLEAARQESEKNGRIKSFVYASSSAVYGDHPALPKSEGVIGNALSPYAASKRADELYAQAFSSVVRFPITGLRYFNVFGPRQDPEGAYAAVIPRWTSSLIHGQECVINGDGETSRDFCFVSNVVLANLLSALRHRHPETQQNASKTPAVYNVAAGARTDLLQLYSEIKDAVEQLTGTSLDLAPRHAEFRAGDVRHSLADISKIQSELGFRVQTHLKEGIEQTVKWFYSSSLPQDPSAT